jgi:hypothetical protein
MSKDAIKAMEHANPAGFSHIASKGFYFDRPIAAASRCLAASKRSSSSSTTSTRR